MKNVILVIAVACLLMSPVAFAHGGTYSGPTGSGTGGGFAPGGGADPGGGITPGGGAQPGGGVTPGGVTGGGVTGGGHSAPTGAPVRPGGHRPGGGLGGGISRGGVTGPRRKKVSNPYLDWKYWWELNDDRFLLLKNKLRADEAITDNADIFVGNNGGDASDLQEVTKRQIRKDIIPTLIFALKDPYYDARAGAVIAFSKVAFPKDDDAFHRICDLLDDENKQVRESACIALGILGNKKAIPLLKNIVLNNSKGRKLVGRQTDILNRTRSFAAMGLGLIGTRDQDANTSDFLVDIIKGHHARDLKVASVISLHLINNKTPIPDLISMFKDKELDTYVKAHVGVTLGKLGAKSATYVLSKGINHKNEHVSRSAAIALGLLGNGEDKNTVKLLKKKATSGVSRSTKNFSLLSLGEVGSREATRTLLKRLKKGQVMDKAYASLGLGIQGFKGKLEFKSEVAKIIYREYNNTKSPNLKGALAISLGLLDAKEYADTIRKDIGKIATQNTQGYLAIALALLNDQNSIPVIRELVSMRGNIDRRKMASIALGMLKDRKAVSLLEDVMKRSSNSKAILGSATTSMGHIGDRSAIPILSKILKNRGEYQDITRAFATVALGYLGDKDDIPLLSKIHENCNYMAPTESLSEILTIL